jgi:hypothetical protein
MNQIEKLQSSLSKQELEAKNDSDKNLSTSESKMSDSHNKIFSDSELYKKSWTKLNTIHKKIKIKEFVNELKFHSEKYRKELQEKLLNLLDTKELSKKDKVMYDSINCKIISLTNLEYKDGNYHYL